MAEEQKAVKKKKTIVKAAKLAKSAAGQVKLVELAKEANVSPQRARQKLRAAEVSRDGRWSWDDGSKALKDARKALGLGV